MPELTILAPIGCSMPHFGPMQAASTTCRGGTPVKWRPQTGVMKQDMDSMNRVLGKTAGIVPMPDRTAIRVASVQMAMQATHELCIFSRDLDAVLCDNATFGEAVQQLALRSPRSRIAILLFDLEPPVRNGHCLLDLSRQLPSRIGIRKIPIEHKNHLAGYLIADGKGYVLRPQADVLEGQADFSASGKAQHLRSQFENIWERSETPLDLISFGRGL
jgi:hypothetical protein